MKTYSRSLLQSCGLLALMSACSSSADHSLADGGSSTTATSSSGNLGASSSSGHASSGSSGTAGSVAGSTASSSGAGSTASSSGGSSSGGLLDGGTADAGSPDAGPLEVVGTIPLNGELNVGLSPLIGATFNQAVDPTTLNSSTFTLVLDSDAGPDGGLLTVPGHVSCDAGSNVATFSPIAPLGAGLLYTATIAAGATSATGLGLTAPYSWSFTTGTCISPAPVDLRTSGSYVILAETGISTVPASAITGNIAVSPAAATFITGFSLTLDASGTFSTSTQVVGDAYASDYTEPTPSNLTTAIGDMGTAFTDAAGRTACVTGLGAGDIGGMTLAPGVYGWGTGLLIPTDVYLDGSATDVWVFEIGQDLTLSSGVNVFLEGGAVAKNVFWQVSGQTALNTTSHLEGVVLCQTSISLATGATVNGRLLAQAAITLDTNTVVQPAP